MKKIHLLSTLILLLVIAACKKNDSTAKEERPMAGISFISPTRGKANTVVTIEGQGFLPVHKGDSVKVLFNGKLATLSSISASELIAMSPADGTSGPVTVIVNGDTAVGSVFSYGAPFLVSSVRPRFGPAGTVVTISGKGFGNNPSLVEVLFNNVLARVRNAADTSLQVEVPVSAGKGFVKVVAGNGKDIVLGSVFTSTSITSFTPSSGYDGSVVTITGVGFDPVAARNVVTFNRKAATVAGGDSTMLVVGVPAGTSGTDTLAVRVNGALVTASSYFTNNFPSISYLGYTRIFTDPIRFNITSGPVGAVMLINGFGFNSKTVPTQVAFNGIPATLTYGVNNSAIIFDPLNKLVYAKIPPGFTSGPVTVTVGGNTVTGPICTATTTGVITFAGTNYPPVYKSGTYLSLSTPNAIVFDAQQNLYLLDNDAVYKIAPDGASKQQIASNAFSLTNLATGAGNFYGTSGGNNIYKIQGSNFALFAGSNKGRSGFADGKDTAARFNSIGGIAADGAGNLMVADIQNACIRKMTATGQVTTPYPSSFLSPYLPCGPIATDTQGNIYYGSSSNDNAIVKIKTDGTTQVVCWWSSILGAIAPNNPVAISVDDSGNVFFTTYYGYAIYKAGPTGSPEWVAGINTAPYNSFGYADGPLEMARFDLRLRGNGLAADATGNIYLAENNNNVVRKVIWH